MILLVIISSLNILYKILLKYNLINKLTEVIKPILRFFGLSESVGFIWLIGYIVGLAYGGAMMIEQINEGKVTKAEIKLLNQHLAVSHSVLEDNLVFAALGVSYWLILAVRLAIAWLVVWIIKLFNRVVGNKHITISQ